MTVQPELDLAHGLVAGVPSKGKYSELVLEINRLNCVPLNTKVEDAPYKASSHEYRSKNTGIYKSGRIAFSISLDEEENPKFDVLKNLQARRTFFADDDERLSVMRKCLINASRIAIANGMLKLPDGYTMDDLHKLKGFKWSWKAGCSMCPCSPAFTTPLWRGENNTDRHNWFEFCFKVIEPVNVVYDFTRTINPAPVLDNTPLSID